MTADYRTARGRLAEMVELLNTDDDGPVMMLYPMTVADSRNPDCQPLLGVIADGDLVALAEHRCDTLTTLRAEVEGLRDEADVEMHAYGCPPNAAHQHRGERRMANRVLDLIDKQREQQ